MDQIEIDQIENEIALNKEYIKLTESNNEDITNFDNDIDNAISQFNNNLSQVMNATEELNSFLELDDDDNSLFYLDDQDIQFLNKSNNSSNSNISIHNKLSQQILDNSSNLNDDN
jgi:hypothetical protein